MPVTFEHNLKVAKKWLTPIGEFTESKSLSAWTEIIMTIRYVGHYNSIVFSDPLIHMVIKEMGGWIFLCQQPERKLFFLQKEFERRYKNYYSNKKLAVPDHLSGHIEQQNTEHDFPDYIPKAVSSASQPYKVTKKNLTNNKEDN